MYTEKTSIDITCAGLASAHPNYSITPIQYCLDLVSITMLCSDA